MSNVVFTIDASIQYEFETMLTPEPSGEDVANVLWRATIGGKEKSTKLGNLRRKRGFRLYLSPADDTDFDTMIGLLDEGSDTFSITDFNGDTYDARFLGYRKTLLNQNGDKFVDVEILEVLS